MSPAGDAVAGLIEMGLEVNGDCDDGDLAVTSRAVLGISIASARVDRIEGILIALRSAAEGAIDVHQGMNEDPSTPDEHKDPSLATTLERLRRFAKHIANAEAELA